MRRLLPLLILLIAAAPAQAQPELEQRRSAEQALEEAQAVADGRGVRTGRELSAVLAELAARRSYLDRTDRQQADELLARPTDAADVAQPGGPYPATARVWRNCSSHFCLHWVDSSPDAPPLIDGNTCPMTPDYVDKARTALEQSYAVQNGQLAWKAPVSDGQLGGEVGKTDVYLKELNADLSGGNLYGYATTDPSQSGRSRYGFMVLDNDYAADEFAHYGGDFLVPLQVTAAHEYNHVLQYGYDSFQDIWMFESTATWAEEKVFPDADDYHVYMGTWADKPFVPLTSSAGTKMYGSAIWNHWLEQRYGADVVRRAWEESTANGDFAPDAYDAAIKAESEGFSFAHDFGDFAAATADWDGIDSGIHEGAAFAQDVLRTPPELVIGAPPSNIVVDHTGFVVFDVRMPSSADSLQLSGTLRAPGSTLDGARGSIALVGSDDGDLVKVLARFDPTGRATVTLPGDPRRFDRIRAVIANADVRTNGFDESTLDWDWTRDDQQATLSLSQAGTLGDTPIEETPAPDATGAPADLACGTTTVERQPSTSPAVTPIPTPAATATPTATPTPTPAPGTSVRLSPSSTRLRTVARKGVLSLFARINKAGRLTARATVDRATARRLRIGRRTTSAGTGRRTAAAPARVKINVKLARRVRAALRRHDRRALRMRVQVAFVPADGTRAVRRSISILLRP